MESPALHPEAFFLLAFEGSVIYRAPRTRLRHSARAHCSCFSTRCMFSALVRAWDGWPAKPSTAQPVCCMSVGEDIGKAEATAVASGRQGGGGRRSLENIKKVVSDKHPAQDTFPYFISRGGNIELKFALLWKSTGSK